MKDYPNIDQLITCQYGANNGEIYLINVKKLNLKEFLFLNSLNENCAFFRSLKRCSKSETYWPDHYHGQYDISVAYGQVFAL